MSPRNRHGSKNANYKKSAARGGGGQRLYVDPLRIARKLGRQIEDALDPVKAPGAVKRYTAEEIAAMNAARKP